MIEIRHLSVSYGTVPALQDLSLCIEDGEFVLISGPSGCGKSTLARCLAGLIPHAQPAHVRGQVLVNSMDVAVADPATVARQVGIVFQNPATQLFNLTVEEEVAFGPRNLGLEPELVCEQVEWALAATGIAALRQRRVTTLSGGEKQRLAIAAVLAMGPRVLILDEPTSSLDVAGTRQVLDTLAGLHRDQGVTILIIEHRFNELARLARRVILLDAGRIVAKGSTSSVLSDRELLRRLGLRRPSSEPQVDWRDLVCGDGVSARSGKPLITLERVSAGYGHHLVLHDVDLQILPGEFLAVVGPNGAGKSTLARVLAGLVKPQAGQVCFADDKRPRPGVDVGLLFQNPLEQLFCETVDEEVAFGPRNFGCFDPFTHVETLTCMGLSDLAWRSPFVLSSGQQQRVALGAALSLRPRLLILDEPTMGQDWRHLSRLMAFLKRLNVAGATALMITHDYKLVHRYADRIVVMENGRIVAEGRPG